MLSSKRICNILPGVHVAHGVVIALAVVVGGCSTDVTRFDFPFFGLTNKGSETASLPTPPESVARNDRGYDDVPSAPPRGAGLGDTGRAYTPPPYTTGSSERVASARDYGPPPGPSYAPSSERYAGARRQWREHPGAAGRYALRHRQALWRVDLGADRGQRPRPRRQHQAGSAA